MKITDVKIYTLDAFRTNWAFIKVETDEGLYGWGEASLGTNEMALEGMIADLRRLVIGRNPLEIERFMFEVYRDIYWKGGPVLMSAMSGIEIAMWDIAGKFFNTPVSTFFGGKMRDRVKMYANAWFVGAKTPEEFAKKAKNGLEALHTPAKEVSTMQKLPAEMGIRMSTLTDTSNSKIAELMVNGSVMGVSEFKEIIRNADEAGASLENIRLAGDVLAFHEEMINKMRRFL